MSASEDPICARCGRPHARNAVCPSQSDTAGHSAEVIPFKPRPASVTKPFTPDEPDGPSAA